MDVRMDFMAPPSAAFGRIVIQLSRDYPVPGVFSPAPPVPEPYAWRWAKATSRHRRTHEATHCAPFRLSSPFVDRARRSPLARPFIRCLYLWCGDHGARQYDRPWHQAAQPIRLCLQRPVDGLGIQSRIDGRDHRSVLLFIISTCTHVSFLPKNSSPKNQESFAIWSQLLSNKTPENVSLPVSVYYL